MLRWFKIKGSASGNVAEVTASNEVKVIQTGVATSAKQDLLLTELQAKADLTETQPVSIAQALTTKFNSANLGPFGDLITSNLTPIFQTDAIYGLLSQQVSNTISGTGALVDTNNSRYRIQSGTTATTGSALLTSVIPFRYRAGEGVLVRFTSVFNTGTVGNVQELGVGTTKDKYCFGYNGTSYGILHRNNDVDTWIPQASWNGDKCDGTGTSSFNINPQLGNVNQIMYPFLGYGNIKFYIQDSATSDYILVHTIKYTNSSTATELTNPSLNMWARCANTGANTSNVTMYNGSFAAFVVGKKEYIVAEYAIDNLKTAVSTELNILTLRNATTFNGVLNKAIIRIKTISFASDGGNGLARLRVKKSVTLGGVPAYTTISGTSGDNGVTITNGQSTVSYDVAGTTITGGVLQFNSTCARNGNSVLDVADNNIFLYPGESMTFSALSQVNTDIAIAINWDEDI